jgi:excisionase family DNA binding protein
MVSRIRTAKPKPQSKSASGDADAFLSRAEAAAFCRLNIQTIDAAIKNAELRCYHVGRRRLLHKPDVLKWMLAKEA